MIFSSGSSDSSASSRVRSGFARCFPPFSYPRGPGPVGLGRGRGVAERLWFLEFGVAEAGW